MTTTPEAYDGTFDLQTTTQIGHFSRVGAQGEHVRLDDTNMRVCRININGKDVSTDCLKDSFAKKGERFI